MGLFERSGTLSRAAESLRRNDFRSCSPLPAERRGTTFVVSRFALDVAEPAPELELAVWQRLRSGGTLWRKWTRSARQISASGSGRSQRSRRRTSCAPARRADYEVTTRGIRMTALPQIRSLGLQDAEAPAKRFCYAR